jgi:hypothetical protein
MQLLVQFLEAEVLGKELAFRKSSHPISGKQVKAGYRRSIFSCFSYNQLKEELYL